MSDSIDRVFVHALNTVKRIPRTGTARPPAAERLRLYGLYKQSMEGDVEGVMDRPVGNTAEIQAECEKWDSWYGQRGLSRTEAKRRYISTLIETMHRYASQTPEARELVSELEFVWDQVKANTSSTSSSPSSPGQAGLGVPTGSQPSYGSIGGRLSRGEYDQLQSNPRGDSSLRVLSPVSQPDEDYRPRSATRHNQSDGRINRKKNEAENYHGNDVHDHGEEEEENEEEEEQEEEEEEFEEARDSLYDSEVMTEQHSDGRSDEGERDLSAVRRDSSGGGENDDNHQHHEIQRRRISNRKWQRRVEQALTKMTAEIAAFREQMEARAVASRRRSSLIAWLKWVIWIALRQIVWQLVILGLVLTWMRIKGDRRLEHQLKVGWSEVKARLIKLKALRRLPGVPSLP